MKANRRRPRTRRTLGLAILVCLSPAGLRAANPVSGTVSESNPRVTWTGPVTPASGAGCGAPNNEACDNFLLTIVPPSAGFGPYVVEILLEPALAGDWDAEVYDSNGVLVDDSANLPGQSEVVILAGPSAGTYAVAAAPFAPAAGPDVDGDLMPDSYVATAELRPATPAAPGSEPITYAVHPAPSPLGRGAAEPSCGVNWKTNRVMFISGLETLRISFDDCTSPARDTWEDKSFLTTSTITADPILFTDSSTGRTFVSQLLALGIGAGGVAVPVLTKQSLMAFTDDDGDNWTPSQGSGINSGVDHQTVGGGLFGPPLTRDPAGPVYPNAVYYCSQDIADAMCARSDDGGLMFGPAVPMYAATECNGLHGAVKVASNDGTVYVPNKGCNGKQAVVVSEDHGLTWEVREIAGSRQSDWDPSVGIATDGTIYVGYGDGNGHPTVAVSRDKGRTWINIRDVGANVTVGSQSGLRHTAFPVAVAGDPDRAAVAWLGSTEPTSGAMGDDPNWPGDWYVFAAHTYDGGLTWTTVNVTPNDPVQRGTICGGGFGGCANGTRNLLDFNDSDVDAEGRVVLAYADGCIGPCIQGRPNSFTEVATVARQVNGRRLFARFDGSGAPAAPLVTAVFDACPTPAAVVLSWPAPDDHGSPITAYNVRRRTAAQIAFTPLATVDGSTRTYLDTGFDRAQQNFYQVTAVNSAGEGLACGEALPECLSGGAPEDPCTVPGLTLMTDGSGDFTLPVGMQTFFGPALDIQKLSIAEPGDLGAGKVMFILKMASLANVPPNSNWPVLFRGSNGTDYIARMHTNALGTVFFSVATGTETDPIQNPGVPADPASGFDADGGIRVVAARSTIGNPAPGENLTMFLVRVVSPELSATGPTPDNMPDGLTRTGTYTLRGSENCVCDPPDAADDAADTPENTPVVVNVVQNDADAGNPPLAVIGVSQPANGSVTDNGDGTVTYRPGTDFVGDDRFDYTIENACGATDTAAVQVTVFRREVCFEDTAPEIAYSSGWHTVEHPAASDGHYRLHSGRSSEHGLSFTFTIENNTGSLSYHFARSPKGEEADVYIDGRFIESIDYESEDGSTKNPEFGRAECVRLYPLARGTHTFELRNLEHRVYVDRFCVINGGSNAKPDHEPGETSSDDDEVASHEDSTRSVSLGDSAVALSVVAETESPAPLTLLLISPGGIVLDTAAASGGLMVIDRPVTEAGIYVIKVVTLSPTPIPVWTAVTPVVKR